MFSSYQPEITSCQNKWCENKGLFPTSGNEPVVAGCGSYDTMEHQRIKTGGTTGRGVTPCEFGFLQKIPKQSMIGNEMAFLYPYSGLNFQKMSPSSIFFDPTRPGYLPPTGQPRSLRRVGYEWRN